MNPTEVDATILAQAADGGMVVTHRQLIAAGVSRSQIHRRIGQLLVPLSDGVYAVGPITADVRLMGALAALPHAVTSHVTAGTRHGLTSLGGSDDVAVLLAGRRTRRHLDGVRIHFTRWLPAMDITLVGGLPATTVDRTLCDLSVHFPASRLRHLIEQAILDRKTTATAMQACLLGWCRRGRPGSATLRRTGQLLLDTDPVPHSELERRARALFRRARLAAWVEQHRPPWYDGIRGVVDYAWPEARLVVEVDGRRWHATTQAHVEDRRRDRLAAEHGWLTLRFGWQEIVERPNLVIDECRAALCSRLRAAV